MTPKATSARYMPSLAERAELRLRELRLQKVAKTLEVVKPYIPHPPSETQREFLSLEVEEALFGGATRGGKSDAGLMGALQYVDVPNYSAGIFRLTDEDWKKPDSLRARAQDWFAGTAARWDTDVDGFRFPSGATIHFGSGYNGNLKALLRAYQGIPFQYIFIDELTQWPEPCYRFLFSRLVRLVTQRHVPLRMRSSGTPDGPGRAWVKGRFADHATHVQSGSRLQDDLQRRRQERVPLPRPRVYRSPPTADGVEVARELGRLPTGAHFVPSFVEDNPGVDGREYRVSLAKLDTVQREQLEHGDWWVDGTGTVFERGWFTNYLDEEPPGVAWRRYWDLAGTDPNAPGNEGKDPAYTAGVRLGFWYDSAGGARLVIAHVVRAQLGPNDVPLFVRAAAEADGRRVPQIFEQEPGSAGLSLINGYATSTLRGWDVHGDRKTGDKPTMWRPLASFARAGGVCLVRGAWNADFVEELVGLPNGKKDQADAAAGGYAWLLEHDSGPAVVADAVTEDSTESHWRD